MGRKSSRRTISAREEGPAAKAAQVEINQKKDPFSQHSFSVMADVA
jgi:hypothetical protein